MIDRVVLLSLVPHDRWAELHEIAAQLGVTDSQVSTALADLIADGELIDASGSRYRRYRDGDEAEPAPVSLSEKRRETGAPALASFGQMLSTLRVAAGLSQNKLARAADINPAYVCRFEKGGSGQPSRHVVLSLAEALALDSYQTDRLLYAAGLAPKTDWMALALDYWARLSAIDRALTGIAVLPECETVERLEHTA